MPCKQMYQGSIEYIIETVTKSFFCSCEACGFICYPFAVNIMCMYVIYDLLMNLLTFFPHHFTIHRIFENIFPSLLLSPLATLLYIYYTCLFFPPPQLNRVSGCIRLIHLTIHTHIFSVLLAPIHWINVMKFLWFEIRVVEHKVGQTTDSIS